MQALNINSEFLLVMSEKRNRLRRAIMLADDLQKKLDAKLDGPAKNFLPGYLTVDQARDMKNQIGQARRELQYELDDMDHNLFS